MSAVAHTRGQHQSSPLRAAEQTKKNASRLAPLVDLRYWCGPLLQRVCPGDRGREADNARGVGGPVEPSRPAVVPVGITQEPSPSFLDELNRRGKVVFEANGPSEGSLRVYLVTGITGARQP